jgi:phage/plasmid-associated DNA primase
MPATFTFTEKPCIRALHFLKHISFNKFKTISAKKCKNEEDRFQCFNKMKHYVKTALDNRGLILCNYEYSPNTPKTLGGRLFSLNSIQQVACEIRGLLFKHTTDIDISNCHPTLLLYLCKKNDIPCTHLQNYVENRDSVLSQISPDRGEAKHIFLCAINDSEKSYKVCNNAFFRAFDNEMKNIQQIITAFPQYKPYRDAVPDDKIYNQVGSAINRILCGFENEILQHCIEMIQKTTKFEISTLMFDGFMLDGNHYNNPQLLRDLETYVESLYPGLNLKFTFKKHDDSITIPENFDYNDLIAASLTPDQKEMVDEQNHHTAANTVVELIGDIYVCVDKRNDTWFYYNDKISLWETDINPKSVIYDRLNTVILTAIHQAKQYHKTLMTVDETSEEVKRIKKQIENYEKFKNKIGNLTFINSVYSLVRDRLFSEHFTENLNRELFALPLKNNLVIDLKTNNIYPRERRHNFSIISPVAYDETNMDFGFKYFESLFPDSSTRQCVLDAIKSSMTGVPLRNIFFWIGSGCNGKSLLLKVIRKILSDFCNVVSKNIIINSKSASNITSELESLSTLRFGQISELSDTDSLNQTRVKEFTGDGIINFRGLFQKEKTIDVTASIHVATNNIPQIDCSDPAMLTRIIPFPFKSVFEPDSNYADLVMENVDSIFSYIVKVGQVKKSFIIDNMSEEIKECRKEKIINSDSFVSFVHAHLEKSQGSRVAVAAFIEGYYAYLATLKEPCFLSNKKVMELLRKLGFELLRSHSVYFIENTKINL